MFGFISSFLKDFEVLNLTDNQISNKSFKNQNLLFLNDENINDKLNQEFISQNNTLFFISNRGNKIEKETHFNSKFFNCPINTKQFIGYVKDHFFSKTSFFRDVEIYNEKIINKKNNLSCVLTNLERKLLLCLVNKKKIHRDNLLEEIFELKKNIQTKTIESHLSRIRKKINFIESKIKIFSKGDIFYIDS